MKTIDDLPSADMIINLLKVICPGCGLKSILPVDSSHSNHTHLIEAVKPDGAISRIIVRRYSAYGNRNRSEKARREFMALKFVRDNGIPAPEPIYLDEQGEILQSPGIVTKYVEGKHDMNPGNPDRWAAALAGMLAKIHALPCTIPDGSFILDANGEAAWFLRDGIIPEFMQTHPQGIKVWEAAARLFKKIKFPPRSLVHIDYWPGNILWQAGKISAVVDWEDAAYGDPAIDVAYARMEMSILGLAPAADTFLREYEKLTGQEVANLIFWELAASAKPMFSPPTWDVVDVPRRERFDLFVRNALKKAAAG